MKRRLLKYALIALAVILFTGYFAFSTFFFSPTEADYEADVSTLIPRDVDFYLSKAELADDFEPFPLPAALPALEATDGGRVWFESTEWRELRAEWGLLEVREEVERTLASLPIELDPLDVIGGEDLAVAGYFRGPTAEEADWGLYARGNWMAKLALALLRRPGLVDLESQGLVATVGEDGVSLSGGELPRVLHITRVNDVMVIATDPGLVAQARALADVKGEDSFGGSARYYDHIQQRDREGDELESFVDWRALSEARQYTGRWPDQEAPEFLPAFLGRVFQSGALRELAGILRFGGGAAVEVHAELSSELVSPFQKQLYRARGFDRDRLFDVARFAPQDTALLAYFHAPFGAVLRQVLDSLEPAARDNLDDLVREVWKYPDAQPLLDELAGAFKDRALFMMRNNDYDKDPDGPPNDGRAVFAWSLILWLDDADKIVDVREMVRNNQSYFGLQGANPGDVGVYRNLTPGGQEIFEFWSPFIAGTGHLASVTERGQGFFVLSNHHRMLGDVLKTFFEGGSRYPRLADKPRFAALVNDGLVDQNVAIWLQPQAAERTLRALGDEAANELVVIDWSTMRGEIDRRVLRENFPDWDYGSLTQEQQDQLETLAKPARDAHEREVQEAQVPVLRAKYERQIRYASEIEGGLLSFALDPKSIELYARILMSLGD